MEMAPTGILDLTKLKPDTLLEGPMWEGVARFKGITTPYQDTQELHIELDGKRHIISLDATRDDHGIREAKLPKGKPWKTFVAVERLRHEYARNLGTLGSADPLPHQLKTIYQVSGVPGRIRFMIADEPGGGKTIVASRIIQELFMQKQVQRVLVVVPALLKYQWQSELKQFVNMDSDVIESGTRRQANPWLSEEKPILITSMDYAKQDNQMEMLEQARFDLAIVDEAHNLNATLKNVTGRYRLGELLGRISEHMIFLTATPHRGKADNFRLLLKLLEPDMFDDRKMTEDEVFNKKSKLFIRHTKPDMVDMNEKKLFLDRSVVSLKYNMSKDERRMYEVVSEYVQRQYNLSLDRDPNTIASFALLLIQKRMASSTHALLETLRRRHKKLSERLEGGILTDGNRVLGDLDSMTDEQKEELERDAEGQTLAQDTYQLRQELNELDGIIETTEAAIDNQPDTKLAKLLAEIDRLGTDKMLIFSEYRDTLDYLEKNIREHTEKIMEEYDTASNDSKRPTYGICRIDGKMPMPVREDMQKVFRTTHQIMLATDAAREGINLQFCHRMVNYDLPWSPISLEQRMGRLHRYGQKEDVEISNMVAADTREGDVMDKLFEKIRLIEKQYPTFNVMGQILAGGDLEGLMTDAIRTGSTEDVGYKVEEAAKRGKRIDEMLGHSTPINTAKVREKIESIKAQRTDGKYLVDGMKELFKNLGGSIRELGGKTSLDVPIEVRYGPLKRVRMRLEEPPDKALARNGNIYNHLMGWVEKNCANDLKSGSVFLDPKGLDGWIFFHTIRILNKRRNVAVRLLMAHFYESKSEKVAYVEPFVLHRMKYDEASDAGVQPLMDKVSRAVQKRARIERDKLADERKAFWDHRMDAATRRTRNRKEEITLEISRTPFGTKRDELEAEREKVERQLDELRADSEAEMALFPDSGVFQGWVRVKPTDAGPEDPSNDPDVEKMGMDVSMEHERSEGFDPKDVSGKRGIGYDILSRHPDGRVREIEVKARCGAGNVQLTQSEYEHAKKSKNAVIHVISNVDRPNQRLTVVSNTGDLKANKTIMYNVGWAEIQQLSD